MPRNPQDVALNNYKKTLVKTAPAPLLPTAPDPNKGLQRTQLTTTRAQAYIDQNNSVPVVLQASEIYQPGMGGYDSIYASSTYKYAQNNPDPVITRIGYRTLTEMLTMAACRSPFNLKRSMVLSDGGRVVPAIVDPSDPNYAQAKEFAQFCTYMIDNIKDVGDLVQDFRLVLWQMLEACWYGFQYSDVIWRKLDTGPFKGNVGLAYIAAKPAQEIGFELDFNTMGVRNIMPYTILGGYAPPVALEKGLLYTYSPQFGLPYGSGDGRACYKHYMILDNLLGFWATACERWGSPVLVMKYPAGNAAGTQAAQEVADNIRQGAAAVLPDNIEYELVKTDASALQAFKTYSDFNVEQLSLNILGATLTTGTGEGAGSYALGKVHQANTNSYVDMVQQDIEGVISYQLFRRAIRYNYGAEYEWLAPKFKLTPPQIPSGQSMLEMAQTFNLLVGMGNMDSGSNDIRAALSLPPIEKAEREILESAKDLQVQQQVASIEKANGSDTQVNTSNSSGGEQSQSGSQRADGTRGGAATSGNSSSRRVGKKPDLRTTES